MLLDLIHLCELHNRKGERESEKSFNLIELRSFFIGHFRSIIIYPAALCTSPGHHTDVRIYLILIFLQFFYF